MKALLLLALAAIFLLGCASPDGGDAIRQFLPGTYIRFGEQEFGKEWDTLTIALQNSSANEYSIQRAWKYARVLDGKALVPEYKVKTTSAIYDVGTKILNETQTGQVYSVSEDGATLFAGTVKYLKLK